MSLKRRPASKPSHERWLVSYADFITLLFAFFVVMFAASAVDQGKIGKLAAAIQLAFRDLGIFAAPSSRSPAITGGEIRGALPPITALRDRRGMSGLGKLQKDLARALAGEIQRGEVAMKLGREGLVVSLREVGFFDSGSAEVKLKSEPALARLAKVLAAGPYYVRIEGHTDNLPIHTERFASNWELSTARATGMARLFITRYEFPAGRLSAAGFAEFHPVASNRTAEGRALNRRIDIVVVGTPSKARSESWSGEATNPLRPEVFKEGVPGPGK
jgi:chemotaxis protein MotB